MSEVKILCGDREYVVTDEDVLWLKRAVLREGAVMAQVAQCLVNGFAAFHSTKPKSTPTLTWWVRAYAQPVNPRWFPEGKIFQKWHARDPKRYPLAVAKKRRDVYSTKMHFNQDTLDAVERALTEGPVDIPPNATDYAASWIDSSRRMTALTKPRKGVNRLWTRKPGWGGYQVVAESDQSSPGAEAPSEGDSPVVTPEPGRCVLPTPPRSYYLFELDED